MIRRVRAFDWSNTPLGPMDQWPQTLRVAVDICLNSRFPMFVWWGPDLINIYNDAYVPILGKRHPEAFGKPAQPTWSEIWSVVGPQAEAVMQRGEATWNERVLLVMERKGYTEDTYFTWSYSPIPDGAGGIGGLFSACTEETQRVLAERERDRLDSELRTSQERYRNFIHLSSEGIWRFELEEHVPTDLPEPEQIHRFFRHAYLAECNDALARMYGFASCSEIIGRRLHAFHDPRDPRSVELLTAFIRGGYRLTDAQSAEPDRHGNLRTFLNSMVGFVEDGRLVRAWGTQRDVTDRVRQEKRYAEILESISDAFYAVDADFRFVYVNRKAEELWGRRREDLVGKHYWSEFPQAVGTQSHRMHLQAMTGRRPVLYEAVSPIVGRWMDVSLYPESGGGLSCYFRDIQERKESEERLRRYHDTFYHLIQNNPFGIYVVDADFKLRQVSLGAQKVFSSVRPLLGRDFADVLRTIWAEPFAGQAIDIFRHTLETGEPYASPSTVEPRADIPVTEAYDWRIERVTLPDGRFGVVCYFYDLSERQRWETELSESERRYRLLSEQNERLLVSERAARAEAESANNAKDRFLAVLSHELRTPLSPVVMTIPAIEIDPELPYKFREDLAMIRRNIDLEVKLIDDLLDLSRVSSGKLRLQMQPVHVHDLLRHAIHSSLSDTAGKRLDIRHELHAPNDRLSADPARLQQVFWNLLRNAVKFTPDGGAITVRTWNDDQTGHLAVEVTDTGVGIPAELVPRVFDAFEQGDQRMTRQFGGLGLGLAIAKAVVEMHGGAIAVASEGKDRGATFTIRLATLAEDERPVTHHPGETSSTSESPGTRVLLVEDHPDTARTLARLLQSSGYDVKTAHSVASALQMAAQEPFDLVVSDIGLPDATGYDLMTQLRDRYGIKGIALSGYGMEDDMRRSREAGFVDHVVKPVNVAQLEGVIGRILRDK